jgi:nucleotide-binding universal stress UspA family protein
VKEQIVVGVGGMERQVQLTWAIAESRRWGAPLLIVHCYAERYQSELPEPSPNDVDNAKSVLALAAEAAEQSGVVFDTLLGDGFPGEVLVEASEGASNLVIGSSHRSRLSHARHSSVSTYCARHAHCPVTIVPSSDILETSTL